MRFRCPATTRVRLEHIRTNRGEQLTEFRRTMFRAGHAHAGVLQVMALVFYVFMVQGQPGTHSLGTRITTAGAAVMTAAILVLVYGLIVI